jgi:hypothetical protein
MGAARTSCGAASARASPRWGAVYKLNAVIILRDAARFPGCASAREKWCGESIDASTCLPYFSADLKPPGFNPCA